MYRVIAMALNYLPNGGIGGVYHEQGLGSLAPRNFSQKGPTQPPKHQTHAPPMNGGNTQSQ